MKLKPIFIVHYFNYGLPHLAACLELTSQNNPGRDIHLITLAPEVCALVDGLSIPNVTAHQMNETESNALFDEVKAVFYHDQKNPEMFDLMCFVRYKTVEHYIRNELKLSAFPEFYFCDSDIGVTSNIDELFGPAAKPGQVVTSRKKAVYFSSWSPSAFEQFVSMENMAEYFEYAESKKLRCSDMEYLFWSLNEKKNISWRTSQSRRFLQLDHIRAYLFQNYWFTLLDGGDCGRDDRIAEMAEFPGGIWREPAFMLKFAELGFLEQLFIPSAGPDSHFELNMALAAELLSRNRQRYSELAHIEIKSLNPAEFDGNPTIGMIHFQGSGKEIAPSYRDYWLGRGQ